MNKSYKLIFNKARGELVTVNEMAKSHSKSKVIVAVSSIALCSLISLTASAAVTVKPTVGYRITSYKTDINYTAEESNNDYETYFSNGIDVADTAFNLRGYSAKNSTVSFALTVPDIAVKFAQYGINTEYANVNLGNTSTKTISFFTSDAKAGSTTKQTYGISAKAKAGVTLAANDIHIVSESSGEQGSATSVSVSASSNPKHSATSVNLKAKQNLSLSSSVTDSLGKRATVIGTNGELTVVAGSSVTLSADTISLTAFSNGNQISSGALGIHTKKTDTVVIDAKHILLDVKATKISLGIRSDYQADLSGATITLGNNQTNSVVINSVSTASSAYGFLATKADSTAGKFDIPGIPGNTGNNTSQQTASLPSLQSVSLNKGNLSINAKQIDISATAKDTASAVELWTNNTAVIGNEASIVNISANSSDAKAYGISSLEGSNITINGAELNVSTSGTSGIGISAQNSTQGATDNLATVTINSAKTTIKADTALSAMSQGRIYINGDLETESKTAVLARGNALVSVNETGNNTVKLTGDVDFNYDAATSGTTTDAIVNINLSNTDSSWIGNSKTSVDSGTPSEDLRTGQLNLGLSNGATWTPTEINTSVNNSRAEAIASVTLDNGVINLTTDGASSVDIKNLSGNGTVNTDVTKATDGTLTAAGKLNIQSGTSKLSIMAQGITADDVADESQLTAITDIINGGDSSVVTKTTTVKEGAVKGEITQTTDASGNTSTTQGSNSKLTAFNSISDMATMAWRHDMNDLTKRMGELRDSPEGIGSWVRFYGSEQEYGRQNMTSKSTSVQLGSDYDIGSGWKVGGAFTYTDGTAKYANGSSDNKAYGVAAYGSWLTDNGAFVDLIGKYSRLSSDFELSSMDGKSKNNALSASVEAGWHIPFAELAFVEPQAELTYGVVLGDDFTTSNGVKISQEDTEALIGRLGVRTGFHFPNKKGTVYARASVLHDFKGESEFTASLVDDASVRSTMKDDIGGTYYEIGVGANFNWTDNAYSYVDLEKQNGGDVKENWRWNVGFRYVW